MDFATAPLNRSLNNRKPMEITIKYKSSRGEIAHWYWRMWRNRLWKIHSAFILMIFFFFVTSEGHWPIRDFRFLEHAIFASLFLLIFLVLFPQVKFKPQIRTLTVDENGIKTVIGPKSGTVSWSEVIGIEDTSEYISIIGKTLNAFVVPRRAFQSDEDRNQFLETIRKWQQKSENNGVVTDAANDAASHTP